MFRSELRVIGMAALLCSTSAWAGFVNGDFESGDTTAWATGGGSRASVNNAALNPADFLPGGSRFSGSVNHSAVVGAGIAPHTDGNLNQVYSGNYSFRAEDTVNGGYASVITQTVSNYTDPSIYFAWAAVLEGAHGLTDAAIFKLVLRDETTGSNLITRSYNADSGGGGVDSRFTFSTSGYYYTAWQVEQLDINSSLLGHDFSLTLLAADCQPTGHAGYVYLDGFGSGLPDAVPLPGTLALLGIGFLGFFWNRRRH